MISRRRFLGMSAVSAAGLLVSPALFAAPDKPNAGEIFLVGDGARGDASLFGVAPYSSQPGAVRIWRYGQKELAEIRLPFFPHSFAPRPGAPQRVITFEKWGRHLAEIDLAAMEVVRVTQGKPGRRFFGHGAHSGQFIYATQMDDEGRRGRVLVLDAASHTVVNEFETQGAFPHDCQWLPGTNTLLVVNSRRSGIQGAVQDNFSSLVWIDAKSGKCLKQIFVETTEFGYAHLAHSAEGYMVLAGSYDSSQGGSRPLLAAIHPDGSARAFDVAGSTEERLQGEVLSLYLDEHNAEVTATLPNAAKVQVWNYKSGQFVRQARLAEPRGLAYSVRQDKLLVSSAQGKRLLALDKNLMAMPVETDLGGTGSHLHRLAL